MRFMVFVPGNAESEAGRDAAPRDVRGDDAVQRGAGQVPACSSPPTVCIPPPRGAKVRFDGGERTVIDGPFTESKEIVAGYWIWECSSREEAIEWLKRAPFDGGVEIELRQIFEPEDFGAELTPELREAKSGSASRRPRAEQHPSRVLRAAVVTSTTFETIDAVWRIESARLIAGLTRVVRDVGGRRGPRAGCARRRAGAVAAVGHPGQPGRLADGDREAPRDRRAAPAVTLERKQELLARELRDPAAAGPGRSSPPDVEDVGDDLLRLVFMTCHPVLSREARVALTLRLLGGLTTPEIARAFLVSEPNDRAADRARQANARGGTSPVRGSRTRRAPGAPVRGAGGDLPRLQRGLCGERRRATGSGPTLCEDALRLGRMLAGLMPREPEVHGLLALMELQASRLRARVSAGRRAHPARRPGPRALGPSAHPSRAAGLCAAPRS